MICALDGRSRCRINEANALTCVALSADKAHCVRFWTCFESRLYPLRSLGWERKKSLFVGIVICVPLWHLVFLFFYFLRVFDVLFVFGFITICFLLFRILFFFFLCWLRGVASCFVFILFVLLVFVTFLFSDYFMVMAAGRDANFSSFWYWLRDTIFHFYFLFRSLYRATVRCHF